MTAGSSDFDKPAIKANKKALKADYVVVKSKRGRPPVFNARLFERVLDLICTGVERYKAVEMQGIKPRCWRHNIAKSPELLPQVEEAEVIGSSVLKAIAIRRGIEGSDMLLKWTIQKLDKSWDDKPTSFVNTVVNHPAKVQEIDARLKQADEIGDRLLAQFEARKAIA